MGRDRNRDRGEPVEPGEAREHGNDPGAVRINRGGGGGSGAGRGGPEGYREERGGGGRGRDERRGGGEEGSGEQSPRVRRVAGSATSADGGSSPLQTERGRTNIQDGVVAKIAGIAAQEVDGVRTGGSTSQSVGGLLSSLPGVSGPSAESRGVSVEVGEVEAAVDVTATVAYGRSIPQVTDAVRRNVINRVENLVGLRVTEVNVTVNDVFFPEQERQQQQQQQQRQIGQQQQEPRVR